MKTNQANTIALLTLAGMMGLVSIVTGASAPAGIPAFPGAEGYGSVTSGGRSGKVMKAGETVELSAAATDPDGNKLSFQWWQYPEADSANASVTIANNDSQDQASFIVPNESGKQVHIILEVTDNGTPPLVAYQRIICSIQ